MPTIFTKIINGEIPAHKIMEDDRFLAFLDVRPIVKGHALVIPKKEVDYIFDIEDKELGDLMAFAKKVAKVLRKNIECKKIGVMVAGIEVAHAHIHLVPIQGVGDLNFLNAKPADPAELSQLSQKLRG